MLGRSRSWRSHRWDRTPHQLLPPALAAKDDPAASVVAVGPTVPGQIVPLPSDPSGQMVLLLQ